jgi:hypothetical protein
VRCWFIPFQSCSVFEVFSLSNHRVTAAFGNLAAFKFTRLLDHPDNQVVEDDLKCIEQHVLGHSSRAALLLHCNAANVIANLLLDSRRNNAVKVMAGRCLVCITECHMVREALAPQPIVLQVGWLSFRAIKLHALVTRVRSFWNQSQHCVKKLKSTLLLL